jgi:MarR family transcriptional repressor of emrRAB
MSSGRVELSHTGKILGALAIALRDRLQETITGAAGGAPTAAAALSALDDFLVDPRVGRLQQVLGLTPSGTVRLLDRLEDMGLIERDPGDDGRVREISLTRSGGRVARRVQSARAEVLESALAPLSPRERRTHVR